MSDENSTPMLSVEGMTKLYIPMRESIAGGVADATFTVPRGAFFTLLGPSGCGKTTSLRCVAGLERPDRGRISIAGEIVFDSASRVMVPVYRRDIGMVFQSYAIWPHMSVAENVSFPLRINKRRRYGSAEIATRVRRVLEMVDLSGFENRPATQLSGGQQQRLALARAVIHEPKLLLLDEPLSNLDAKLREDMRVELKQLQQRLEITTIYVTHDQSEALALSDLIAVLDRGRIVQIGTSDEIYYAPNSEFVASFVGAANLFRGRLVDGANGPDMVGLCLMDGSVLRCRAKQKFLPQDDLAVAVRPEAIRVQTKPIEGSSDGDNILHGRIESRTFLGQTVSLRIATAGTLINVTADPETKLVPGAEVILVFPIRRCILVRANAQRQ
jgi:iron(III) transport system ATP-binding protein